VCTSGYRGIFQAKYGGIEAHNPVENRTEYYFIGIIDILQRYRLRKKLEHFLRSLPYRAEGISVVEPSFYAKRFFNFISTQVLDNSDGDIQTFNGSTLTSSRERGSTEMKDKEPSFSINSSNSVSYESTVKDQTSTQITPLSPRAKKMLSPSEDENRSRSSSQ
jgi:hypothetical protein